MRDRVLLLRAMVDAGLDRGGGARALLRGRPAGLLVEGMPDLHPAQVPFAQPRRGVAGWKLQQAGHHRARSTSMRNARPTTLIGVSGQPGAFTEAVVRAMARTSSGR